MSFHTNPVLLQVRKLTRALGVNKFVASVLAKGRTYEDKFESAMLASLRDGDVVWDIGANIGFYSAQFADLVGNGHVVCFEPSSQNFKVLHNNCSSRNNISLRNYGLGAESETVSFAQGEDEIGALSRVIHENTKSDAPVETVEIRKADDLVRDGDEDSLLFPSVVKIDTEGFELEVLKGMPKILNDTRLREIFIEVHFRLLEERQEINAPAKIEQLLNSAGFKCDWVDASHIHGSRSKD